ncbi:hypothetical protein [Almyronema epifaneia]|uniref:Uncharacterized protein n=1 Tax=Almyronema epifaneia S1 TaxID=2991925 RepID=A0ABW6IBJ7_9CYAN
MNPPLQLETPRLLIRDWQPETNAASALQIYGDPTVTQCLGDRKRLPYLTILFSFTNVSVSSSVPLAA